jgi:UDP:flavonoid glycosyltransferase YjiC (YdhE family)
MIIVATGNSDTKELEQQFASEKVFIEKFIPYDFIMPFANVIVTNGGFGGVITALWHGVPMVVAGDSEDKPEIAARIKYCKVGINLKTGHPSPKRIKKAVEKILCDPSYKNNAMSISRDFHTHDAPLETTLLIEEILSQRKA